MLVLGGVGEADLRFVLDQLDGRRKISEVLDRAAADALERTAVADLLALLANRGLLVEPGELVESIEPIEPETLAGDRTAGLGTAPPAGGAAITVADRAPKPGLPRTVGILGGGTAGHLAALALRRAHPEIAVTLIESPDVPVIGVGEATTPLLLQFLHADLGLDVHRLFREVRPTLKLGIRFAWGEGDGFSYPFGPLDLSDPTDLDASSLGAALMAAGRLPILSGEQEAPTAPSTAPSGPLRSGLGTEVAYHLDNRRFTDYLAARAEAAGVSRILATVERVEPAEPATNGRGVAALHTVDGRRLSFDLYVDCSGFRGLLVGGGDGREGAPFLGYERSLFTDGAVIGRVPRGAGSAGPRPHTVATTRAAGWSWAIPQEGEDHVGSVFCGAFASPERVEDELRAAHPGLGATRTLRFRSGRREWFWRDNVVALGNAYGFVEPLESTAIHLAIRQILLLIDHLPLPEDETERGALLERLNRRVADHWDYVAWFLALHFKLNRRLDTAFWRACRDGVDVSRHGELIEAFRARGPLTWEHGAAGPESSFAYPDPLWGPEGIDVLLLGQGLPCPARRSAPHAAGAAKNPRASWRVLVDEALPAGEALRLLHARPELLESLAEAFRRHGPASAVL